MATALSYVAGMLLGVLVGNIIFEALPAQIGEGTRTTLAAIPALGGLVLGCAGWGVWMGRIAQSGETGRMALAGIIGLLPVTLLLAVGLILLEPVVLGSLGGVLPIHHAFTLLFVPTAFIIAGIGSIFLGLGLRDRGLARTLWWRVGLSAAALFLFVDLLMLAAGWRVGAPGAAERYTMVTVMFVSAAGAALAAGAVIGVVLDRGRAVRSSPAEAIGEPSESNGGIHEN